MLTLATAALLSALATTPALAVNHAYSKALAAHGCTQVDEANGLCSATKTHKQMKKSAKPAQPKIHYLTKEGLRLPRCEDVGGSQADNGTSCWY